MKTNRLPLLAPALLLVLSACTPPAASTEGVTVVASDALCRPTPKGRQVTGCYLKIKSSVDDTLLTVSSPVGALAQVHESRMESNMMMMGELENGLPLSAGQTITLAPGGNHIMVMGVRDPLATGDTVPLTLTFATSKPVEITAQVGQPALAK